MTDKEIIIDGVNVEGCEFLGLYNVCKLKSGSTCAVECENYPNCNYKQLQRKEQELKHLRATLKNKNIVAIVEEHDKLKQECEELKEELKEIKKYLGIESKTIMQRLEELQEFRDMDKLKLFNYEQALEKIEEITKKEIVCDNCNLQGTNKCDSRLCTSFYLDDFCKNLLPIINEVKNEKV